MTTKLSTEQRESEAVETDTDQHRWCQEQREYWDGVSGRYDGLYSGSWSRREDAWVRRQLSFLRELTAPTVVDLGCGTGLGLRLVQQLNPDARYIGVDISPAMASQLLGSARVVVGAIDDLHFLPAGQADVVMALFSSVSFAYDTRRLFGEVFRVLRPGGRAYLSVLSARALSRRWATVPAGRYRTRGDPGQGGAAPVRMLTTDEVATLSQEVGLTVLRATGLNLLSGVLEVAPTWRLGRMAARLFPDRAHTIETVLRKDHL